LEKTGCEKRVPEIVEIKVVVWFQFNSSPFLSDCLLDVSEFRETVSRSTVMKSLGRICSFSRKVEIKCVLEVLVVQQEIAGLRIS
jgi:hypothetical protein